QGLCLVVRQQPAFVEGLVIGRCRYHSPNEQAVVADLVLLEQAALDPAHAALEQDGVDPSRTEERQLRQLELVEVYAADAPQILGVVDERPARDVEGERFGLVDDVV